MQLHGVLQDVELVPARFGDKNVIRVLSQRFIFAKAEQRFKLAIDVENLRTAGDHDGFRSGIQ